MSGLVQRIRGSVRRRARTLFKKQPRPTKPKPTPAYRQALDEIDVAITDIVIIVPGRGVRLAENLATHCPSATVHLLAAHPVSAKRRAELPDNVVYAYCPDQQARLRRLARMPQPQLIIERGLELSGERVDTFRELFGMVAKGGRYVVDSTPAQDAPAEAHDEAGRMGMHLAELAESAKITSGEHSYDIELGRSLGPVRTVSGRWIIAKRLSHQWKIRDSRANELLQARFASAWGEVITSKPAIVHISRAKGVSHGDGLRSLPPDFSVPQRFLRRYVGVNCYVRKRAQLGDYWLPDTFRNPRKRGLDHLGLHSTGPVMARAAGEPYPPTRTLDGPFFYLDSEYFSHFGHVLTDVVGNTWGWQLVKQRVPELRPLLSMPSDHATVPAFQRQIFAALGIDPDSIEYVRPGGVQVAELYSCTSDWAMPRYCAPELVSTLR